MGPFQKFRYKTRVGLLLTLLLLVLVLNNIAGRENLNQIEKTAQSIYEDRLMPSTYIFELREHLDGEHALLASARRDAMGQREQRLHRAAITELVSRYEKTVLTAEERTEWNTFKRHLSGFQSGREGRHAFDQHFQQALKSLNHLNVIQAGVGRQLNADMSAIAGTSTLMSYLETALIIIIGGLTLSLIGFSKSIFVQSSPRCASLN